MGLGPESDESQPRSHGPQTPSARVSAELPRCANTPGSWRGACRERRQPERGGGNARGAAGCAECGAERAGDRCRRAGAAPVLAKRGARFGALLCTAFEEPGPLLPFASRDKGLASVAGPGGGCRSWGQENFWMGHGEAGQKRSQERDAKPTVCNLGKGGKKGVGEETETKKKKKKKAARRGKLKKWRKRETSWRRQWERDERWEARGTQWNGEEG